MNISPVSSSRLLSAGRNSSSRIGIACLPALIAVSLLGSAALSFGQDEQPSATQVPHILRRHILNPSSVPSNPNAPRVKPQLRTVPTGNATKVATGTGVVYTCASNVAASTCNYLNTVVAGYYNDVFLNANANIYVQYGPTGLGSSVGYINLVQYTPYVTALTNISPKSSIQKSALSAINTYATPVYGTQNSMEVTVALGTALGFTGLAGINASETASCTPYTSGCYNEIVTVADATTQAQEGISLYYDDQGGTEGANQYDFYAVVQHETDEVLGTSSCISTQSSSLTDSCDFAGGSGVPSAVDLDRYSSPGTLARDTTPSTAAGQYFSYDGGAHYGAYGRASTLTQKVYNTLSNGNDFADYISSSPDCGTNAAIQDAQGCPGEDAGMTVLNDGQSEFTILNAIGYKIPEAVITSPSPGSTLSGSSVTFTWGAVSGATAYWVYVGTTGVGSSNIFANSSQITATSQAVTGLPTSGTVYVRVYSLVGNFWTPIDYTFTGGNSAPAVTLTPTSLTFASTPVGSTTAPQSVTIKNTGSGTLTLTSETITGTNASSFIISANTCGASLAANASCSVSVEFKPAVVGSPLSASLSIADNASGSPHLASLSGTGTSSGTSTVSLSPSSIAFPQTVVGRYSNAQVVTLTNTGTLTVTISSIALGGTGYSSFVQIGTCGTSLAPGASCNIYVSFRPFITGALSGVVLVTDSASGSPQKVTLSGTGAPAPPVSLSATSLAFPTTKAGTVSMAQTVTVTNNGTATLYFTLITLTGANPTDFMQLNTCGPSLAPSASCSIFVAFRPAAAAAYTGTLAIYDNGASSPQNVTLSGTGN